MTSRSPSDAPAQAGQPAEVEETGTPAGAEQPAAGPVTTVRARTDRAVSVRSRSAGPSGAASEEPSAEQPGRRPAPEAPAEAIRVVAVEGGASQEWVGADALAQIEDLVRDTKARFWVDLRSAPPGLVAEVARLLGLHVLLAEDLAERDQRAKLEQVGKLLHLVVFSLGFDDGTIYDRELDFVLGERFLLSSHSPWWDPRMTHHLRMGVAGVLERGPSYLLWALVDSVIDDYFPILDRLGDEIDRIEDEVVGRADRALLERLFELKRQLIQIRRVTSPQREMFNILSSREETLISSEHRLYFRDVYDHLIRLTDELDTYRELASATLEAYLSTVNNNLSLIMKRLTGVTVVVAGIGAIAGIFGMSEAQTAFRLSEGVGFWLVTAGCLVLAGVAAAILHRLDWI
jgi:magnesium transporter